MCTLTWKAREEGGYDLFFNRDERLSRASEAPPAIGRGPRGMRFAAPRDGDSGGTWLMLNEAGLVLALLNDYPRGVVETGRRSRGELPLVGVDCTGAAEVQARLRSVRVEEYAPFHLVALDASGAGAHWRWDGRALHETGAPEFLTSSSFEPDAVRARRTALYAARTEAWAGERFHWEHDQRDGAGAILMRRSDACTRSVCAVQVGPGMRTLSYRPVRWPEGSAGEATEVSL